MSDIVDGFGIVLMDARYFSSGLMSLEVTRKPASSILFWANWNLLGFQIIPFRPVSSR